jgi:two-component system, NarL family, sensor histidine kinase DegS
VTEQDILKKKRLSTYYLKIVSIIGCLVIICSIPSISISENLIFFLFLILLLLISGYIHVPLISLRAYSTFNLPILSIIYLFFGISTTIVALASVVTLEAIHRRRNFLSMLFNMGQFAISLAAAHYLTNSIEFLVIQVNFSTMIEFSIMMILFILGFVVINNLIVDVLIWLRPMPYSWRDWRMKSLQETIVATFSYLYLLFLFAYANQMEGYLIKCTYLLFLLILVLVSATISFVKKVKIDQERMNSLYMVTTELNRESTKNFYEKISMLGDTFNSYALVLLVKKNREWKALLKHGEVKSEILISPLLKEDLEAIQKPAYFFGRDFNSLPGKEIFNDMILSQAFYPLMVDNEKIGFFIVGKISENKLSFEEMRSFNVLSNFLASFVKTRALTFEYEKRMIVEERNRIAREIHDGIGQSLAGVVFQMESSLRKNQNELGDLRQTIEQSIPKLRQSIKEVRQSIYSLKPCPSEQYGLIPAIQEKIQSIKAENEKEIVFLTKGEPYPLSIRSEKMIYDIVQESLQNAIKHSKAEKIEVLLKYQSEDTLVKIKDNGIGFSLYEKMIQAKIESHYGILNMNELAQKLGAKLIIDSAVGNGTEIKLSIPFPNLKGEVS